MAIIVQKYGGTSVGSLSRIEAVAEQVISTVRQGHQVLVVLSAMSGETDRLVAMAQQLDANPASRELDMLMAAGEQVSISLLAIALVKQGFSAISLLASQVGIKTNNHFGRATIKAIENKRLAQAFEQEQVVIVAGFQGVDNENNITTLGRGGSDTSAVALAVAVGASECQIFTDVDGIYTADPRVEPKARRIEQLTFEESLIMASLGAKVLHNRAVECAMNHKMPIRVMSSFVPGKGTLVTTKEKLINEHADDHPVTSIAHHQQDALVRIFGITNNQTVSELLGLLTELNIEVEMLSQTVNQTYQHDVQFVINRREQSKVTDVLQDITKKFDVSGVQINAKVAKISAIGVGLKNYPKVMEQFHATLIKEHIDILLIASSELNISAVIDESKINTAVSRLHQVFKLDSTM